MAKYIQPNFIVDSSASFAKNAAFDSSLYIRGVAHISNPTASTATPYALVVDSIGSNVQIKSRLLGTMAFETSTNYYSKGEVNVLISDVSTVIDSRLDNVDISLGVLNSWNASQDISINYLYGQIGATNAWNGLTTTNSSIGLGGVLSVLDTSIYGPSNRFLIDVSYLSMYGWKMYTGTKDANGDTGLRTEYVASGGYVSVLESYDYVSGEDYRIALATTGSSKGIQLIAYNTNSDEAIVTFEASTGFRYSSNYAPFWTDRNIPDVGFVKSYVDASIVSRDTSLGNLSRWEVVQDASIVSLRTVNNAQDTSLGNLSAWEVVQDASIVSLRNRLDASLANYVLKSGDTMTGSLYLSGPTSNLTVDGSAIFNGTAVFGGNVFFDGSAYFTGVETLDVSAAFIILNEGLTGAPPANLQSGIVINRGTSNPYIFVYDEDIQTFRIGITQLETSTHYSDASTQAVATRQDTPISNGIAYWNSTTYRFDTSTGFTFTPGTGLSLPVAPIQASEMTVLTWNGSAVGSRDLGTMAFEASANYLYASQVTALISDVSTVLDSRLDNIDISISNHDSSILLLNGIVSGKIDAVATVNGVVGGHEIYSNESNSVSYIKKIIAGSGATIISDSSTVTISVSGASGYVSKYRGTFDGVTDSSIFVSAATHTLGVGPFDVAVYESNQLVYVDVTCATNGDVTLQWTPGSLTDASCRFIIMG